MKRMKLQALAMCVAGAMAVWAGRVATSADGPDAFSGTVTSKAEGHMEGVVVTARGVGANHTVSVVTGADGKYHFPKTHIPNGQYDVTIRAAGFAMKPLRAVVSDNTKPVDLALEPGDLSKGMTSADWANSIPDSPQKQKMVYTALSCAYCHTYQRIMRAKHTTDQWVTAINRMSSYYPDGTAASDDARGRGQREVMYGGSLGNPGKNAERVRNGSWGGFQGPELAQYLESITLSGGKEKWPFELKAAPRPKGAATKVIVTQWDMPRKDTVAHDSIVDSKGNLWYTDESRQFVGKLEPKTNTITEYPLGKLSPESLEGARDLAVDKDDNVWFPVRIEGGASVVTKFEPATQKLTFAEGGAYGQFMAMGGDGKIWTGTTIFRRVDPKTMKVDAEHDWSKSPNAPKGRLSCYQIAADSKGNPWCTGYQGSYIIKVDAKTGDAKFWPTPTPNAMPRRNRMDKDDRYWFAEYTADKVGMFDTNTEMFKEWPMRQYTTPYAVSTPDTKGRVYATSNMLESVIRLDTNSGERVEYLMPTDFDSKKLMQDPSTTRPSLLMVNTRNARIVRVEPLD